MTLDKYRYIVVEGPIGVGKTSLAQRMADHLHSGLLLEKPADNPFLENFYGDIPRYALPTQLFFLFQRANQVQGLTQIDMFTQTTVSDFLLDIADISENSPVSAALRDDAMKAAVV